MFQDQIFAHSKAYSVIVKVMLLCWAVKLKKNIGSMVIEQISKSLADENNYLSSLGNLKCCLLNLQDNYEDNVLWKILIQLIGSKTKLTWVQFWVHYHRWWKLIYTLKSRWDIIPLLFLWHKWWTKIISQFTISILTNEK